MRIVLNRETEKIVFHKPFFLTFKIGDKGSKVFFDSETTRQMKLSVGDRVEFEIDDDDWFVAKSEATGAYQLFPNDRMLRSPGLYICSNKLVRGFLKSKKITKCRLERVQDSGQFSYPRFKLIVE